ncbi:MAG: ATP-dependent zinc metalloprotease FtsH [Clostridiales bacterium]|nr:ATP-dependent zinc metalloprotease FtsH [Clostridiales bacterium]
MKLPPNLLGILMFGLLVSLLLNTLVSLFSTSVVQKDISYNEFLDMVRQDKVEEVQFLSDRYVITPKEEEAADLTLTPIPSPQSIQDIMEQSSGVKSNSDNVSVQYYTGYIYDEDLLPLLNEHNVKYSTPIENKLLNAVWAVITWVMPMILIYVLFMFLMNRMSKGMGGGRGGGFMSFGQSNAKVYVEKKTGVTFDDVAGQEEAKESLMEIVDFLHKPEKYTNIGAKQPKGALLVGPPGTGKTLLAKAVAGEANVAFFSLNGSDFVEMFVGVGASRVRDLFKQANQMAPCIVFIDEVDAIGKSRDGQIGGNDEREQTLNQLLAEMDGFDSSRGVVILAATNRPEILDKALLRPGRFDRRIIVERPDLKGREDILKVHIKKVKTNSDVDLKRVALATSGAAGADLANMVNEAALRAVRFNRQEVMQEDLMEAVEVIVAGKEKKDRIMTEKEKRIVAFHEIGHALATARQKNSQPVQKITIVPRTMGALGYVMQMPEEEHYLMTKDEMLTQITISMAGRVAEEEVFNLQTTGASNDIEQATKMARNMVELYGMSEKFGMMGLSSIENKYLDGRSVTMVSQITEADADKEVAAIISSCYEKAKRIIKNDRPALEELAEFLISKETITGEEFMELLSKYPQS